ncbi:MAG: DnaJ C-terminal domain-containing protein [Planctomycetaceae bacterium]
MALDYYQVLGVARRATEDEIRKAFKRLARENHPDLKPNDAAAAERFKQANEAYEVLSDAEKRKQYDTFGSAWKHASKQGAGPFPGGNPFGGGQPVDIDLGDLFGGGEGGIDLGDLFGGRGGGRRAGRHRRSAAAKGGDLRTEINIPFTMAATGGDYDVHLSRNGTPETLTVKVPAGVRDGGTIRLAGQGESGTNGGPAGDLLITMHLAAHPYFRREGNDVYLDVPLTITEAALGTKVDVPTLTEGTVTLTIPAGTSSGAKLRLKGKGFPDLKTHDHGDQYAVVKIVPPKHPSPRVRELLEHLSTELTDQPRNGLW